MKKKTIAIENLPMRPPITFTIAAGTALHYFDPHTYIWGGAGVFMLALWLYWAIDFFRREPTEIFENE